MMMRNLVRAFTKIKIESVDLTNIFSLNLTKDNDKSLYIESI